MKKPSLLAVPLAVGRGWSGAGGFLFQEKSDGQHEFTHLADGTVLNAERMPDGTRVVNDVLSWRGVDVTREPTRARWGEVQAWFRPQRMNEHEASLAGAGGAILARLARTGNGGEFLEAILAAGGEGIVSKPWGHPFGSSWCKCKRSEVFYCRVSALDQFTGSAELALRDSGEPVGRIALRGRFEQVRIGSVLKVEAFGRTARGLLREARLDADAAGSWLVQY